MRWQVLPGRRFPIEKPNLKGINCDFRLRGIVLPTNIACGLGNYPNYRLGPIDSSLCDSLGINNNPIAMFRYTQDTANFLKIEFTDLSYYEPTEWLWDFGDPSSSEPKNIDTSPIHSFSKTGIYRVCLTVKNSNGENTICKNLQLGTTGTNEKTSSKLIISIYPNPVKDYFILMINDYLPKDAHLLIIDEMGKELIRTKVYYGWNSINVINLSNGIYSYSCYDKNNEIGKGKFVKLD